MTEILATQNVVSDEAVDALSRPVLEASTLPPAAYTSPELYALEMQEIFYKQWLCVGRVEELAEPGAFFTTSVADESVIVVRDAEGEIKAHLNVCRHRGCELVEGAGQVRSFKCPYHGWMYALDGALRATPDFRETRNFDKADYHLHPVAVEIWHGFIMVNLDPDAAPLAPQVDELYDWGFEKYRPDELVMTHRYRFEVECNWKVYVENGAETYHTPWVHPGLQSVAPMKDWVEYTDLTEQPWMLALGQFPGLSFGPEGKALFPPSPKIADLDPEFDGFPIVMLFPSMTLLVAADCMVWRMVMPRGPQKSELIGGICLPRESAEAIAAGDPEACEKHQVYIDGQIHTSHQDIAIAEKQQRGLRSHRATPGRFCKHESLAWLFDKRVAEQVYAGRFERS